ncbi:MAG: family 1 glycosylhydrolase [Acidaminobacter sp.]|nr:family 1 glycosylhydrolase [Acidaminobacter sp.]
MVVDKATSKEATKLVKPFKLPDHFLLGSATSAMQIEGGDRNNTWFKWCEEGRIKDGSSCLRAADHWNRIDEDLRLLTDTHQQVYRMGLEWSRIEPENGVFSDAAILHYRRELSLLKENGIQPMVTLHHFSIPLWFADLGGFLNPNCATYFERYVRYVVEHLGDLVQDYVTINEPNVYATNGYYFGIWPPGEKNFRMTMKVLANLARCHIRAYDLIHELRSNRNSGGQTCADDEQADYGGQTCVGVAHHLIDFVPYSPKWLDRAAAKLMSYLFQGAAVMAFTTGRLLPPLSLSGVFKRSQVVSDFMGINYYSRHGVHSRGFYTEMLPDKPQNDLGWEIYPEGLKRVCRWSHRHHPSLPIWITENGTCDAADAFRTQYIYDHLKAVSELIEEGLPVERYYHWSLLDNFELLEGESGPFGLFAVNFETQERTLRKSGEFYAELCRNHGVME